MIIRSAIRWPLAAFLTLLIAACGGGSGGSAPATSPPPPSPPPPPPPPAGAMATISGEVTWDFVPVSLSNPNQGLDYSSTEARPARLVTVQFIDGATVLATTTTDRNGQYSLEVDDDATGYLRVRAEMIETGGSPSWDMRVVDNTAGNAAYTLDGAVFSLSGTSVTRDLHAASGWTGSNYGDPRAAAPFAILDSVLLGIDYILAGNPTVDFPALNLAWSEDNVPSLSASGAVDVGAGEIGSSQFVSGLGILLLGAQNSDTEEYDRHVILHEFAHYLEWSFGRSDSIGGPHSLGDRLDMRVAFSEGLATAFAALALGDPVYLDTGGSQQGQLFGFDVESSSFSNRGWYSEASVQELIYDLADDNNEGGDLLNYSFPVLWQALTQSVGGSTAVTSIFPFINAVRQANPGDTVNIDSLAASQSIGAIASDFAIGEDNDAGSAHVLPVYAELSVNGPAVNVCSTDEFTSGTTNSVNKLSSRRFVKFTPPAAGQVTITVEATSIPPGEYSDPDFVIHQQGAIGIAEGSSSDACENVGAMTWQPGNCLEAATATVTADEHVLEVYEWTNTNSSDDPEFPPIGLTCFDVMVTQP